MKLIISTSHPQMFHVAMVSLYSARINFFIHVEVMQNLLYYLVHFFKILLQVYRSLLLLLPNSAISGGQILFYICTCICLYVYASIFLSLSF